MHLYTKYLLLFTCNLFAGFMLLHAQSGVYIPQAGKVFFSRDTATIFSNFINRGSLGVGKNAVVNFQGKLWENGGNSEIFDDSNLPGTAPLNGGIIQFQADSFPQQITGGYNAATRQGPAFANIYINNRRGVWLFNSSTKVAVGIKLQSGRVFLQDQTLAVGSNNPGIITGFDSTRFFVTGNAPGKGLLLRENIKHSDSLVIFPVGSGESQYTPLGVKTAATNGDDFYATVFDKVKLNVFTGDEMVNESVNKTWQLGKILRPGQDEVEVLIQHQNAEEGSYFTLNKNRAYVAQYSSAGWDEGSPQNYPGNGYLTSGAPLKSSGVNSRTFRNSVTEASYFTKLIRNGDSTVTHLVFGAYRLNSTTVMVNWQTNPEINIRYFIVQRRFITETAFTDVDTVASLAVNGSNFSLLQYRLQDLNNFKGISFYRLKVVSYNTAFYYSKTVGVAGPGFYNVVLWPNPTSGKFFMLVHDPAAYAVVIYNNLGKKMYTEKVNGQSVMEVKEHQLIPGTYYVSLVTQQGTILKTEKLLIINR